MNETVGYFNNLDQVTVASFQNLWFRFLQYLPQIILAIIILVVGWIFASLAARAIKKTLDVAYTSMPKQHKRILSSSVKYSIIVLTVLAALIQLQIVPILIEILFGGIVLALALAFGLGGREEAALLLKNLREQNKM